MFDIEHFQEKCETVFRSEMRKNKEIERFRDSEKSENAPGFTGDAGGRVAFDLPKACEDATAVIYRTGSGERLTSRRCREFTLAVLHAPPQSLGASSQRISRRFILADGHINGLKGATTVDGPCQIHAKTETKIRLL